MTTTPEMIAALHKRYPQNKGQWANVVEFENVDFLAVGCWQSLGYVVHGHEIKVSRSDWLRELKDPYKSWPTVAMCDMWWLAAPKGIAKEEELPDGWGFLEWNGYSFHCVRRADQRRPPFQRDRIGGVGPDGRGIPNHAHFERLAFAKLARRYAYAQADRDHLFLAAPNPQPHLDAAAAATGRWTKEQREEQAKWRKEQRERAKKGW